LSDWHVAKASFDQAQVNRKRFIEEEIYTDSAARECWVEEQLLSIVWPRETNINYELKTDGTAITLDVDLPEIEQMPTQTARPAERGLRVIYKAFGQRVSNHNYARHVHGLLLRLVGEMFSSLPMLASVTVSGYTQRRDTATGHLTDDYIVSVRVSRTKWCELDFSHFKEIDPINAIARFEHRRDMSNTYKFKCIEPFGPAAT
jgi:hypothetical protein